MLRITKITLRLTLCASLALISQSGISGTQQGQSGGRQGKPGTQSGQAGTQQGQSGGQQGQPGAQQGTQKGQPGHIPTPPQQSEPNRTPDVPYVPTPTEVVDAMLRLANVKAGDVVYDLGCGDGRIVITAAKQHGARGVGIDINPQRIKESLENARQAGVTDRVQFKTADLFEIDLSEATVVTLYLLPAINLKLRPKLLRELKPGTRIVSHAFDMGDWKPEKVETVAGEGFDRTIYYWTVPAKGAK